MSELRGGYLFGILNDGDDNLTLTFLPPDDTDWFAWGKVTRKQADDLRDALTAGAEWAGAERRSGKERG